MIKSLMKSGFIFSVTAILCFISAFSYAGQQGAATGHEHSVQIVLSAKHLEATDKKFKGVTDIYEEVIVNMFKYTTGKAKTFAEAAELRTKMIGLGFTDAFVVHYRNGERWMPQPQAKTAPEKTIVQSAPEKPAPVKKETPTVYNPTRGPAGIGSAVVQTDPEFPGGTDSLIAFIKNNLHYPKTPLPDGQHGHVLVGFTIDSKGKILNANVLSGVNDELDSEALRVIHLMPDWQPETIGGNPANAYFVLPFDFYAQNK
jgi:TonB family protein